MDAGLEPGSSRARQRSAFTVYSIFAKVSTGVLVTGPRTEMRPLCFQTFQSGQPKAGLMDAGPGHLWTDRGLAELGGAAGI